MKACRASNYIVAMTSGGIYISAGMVLEAENYSLEAETYNLINIGQV